jgi:hypothetical protein
MKNMKMNKWTMGLAAAGVVTLSSVAQAADAPVTAPVLDASPTLSGYVSTGYKYSNSDSAGYFRADQGRNAFSLDVVDLVISGAQGDGAMDTGYTVELWMGPAASNLDTQDSGSGNGGTVELMQANIDLRVAGIDLKIGQFNTVIGAETYDYSKNPFYTHSWGFAVEPTHHTGLLATYHVGDTILVSAGLANTTGPETNGGGTGSDSSKSFLGAVSYTMDSGTGALTGTKLYYGIVSGNSATNSGENDEYHYASLTLPELVAGLSITAAWDHIEYGAQEADTNVVGLYLSYQLNANLALNLRGEMGNINNADLPGSWGDNADGLESITIGVNYKVWENVISRVEFRNDDQDGGSSQRVVAANVIYSF